MAERDFIVAPVLSPDFGPVAENSVLKPQIGAYMIKPPVPKSRPRPSTRGFIAESSCFCAIYWPIV